MWASTHRAQAGLFCGLSSVDCPLCGLFPSSQGLARCGSCGYNFIWEILQNKSPRRACLKSTIKHTLGSVQDSAWQATPPIPPLSPHTHTWCKQAGWMAPHLSSQPAWLYHKELTLSPFAHSQATGSKGGSNCFSRTGRGISRCSDLIVFFHSHYFDHMREIGSPYNLTFPNPGSCHDLSFN